jgi:hypothetical protein
MKMQGGIVSGMKKRFFIILVWTVFALFWLPLCAESQPGHKSGHSVSSQAASGSDQSQAYPVMPGPGKKIPIGTGHYFTYGFDKALKMGTVIMKVEVFANSGERETSMEVQADSGMPSMRGTHDTGARLFKLSKKGDYLLPIDIVMRGDWEIKLTFSKDGKVVFRGSHQFNV